MLTIKLARRGKKNQPFFRLVIMEKTKDPWGDALEDLGHYNPRTKKGEFNKDRILYWISKGAQLTDSVNNLLINQGIIKAEKRKVTKVHRKKAKSKTEAKEETKSEVGAAGLTKKEVKEEAGLAESKTNLSAESAQPAEKAETQEEKQSS